MRRDAVVRLARSCATSENLPLAIERGSANMSRIVCSPEPPEHPLPALRFEIPEAAAILRMSRAQLYNRIQSGTIKPQKDGSRTYITRTELERYVGACG